MAAYEFDVEGDPRPQPRTRIGRTKGGFSVAYDPGTAKGWKELIAIEAKKVRPAAPLAGPLFLRVAFRFDRPKSHYRKSGELKQGSPAWVSGKGRLDFDNLAKAVADILNDIRFWEDDGLVAVAAVSKKYILPGQRPGALIRIEELTQ